MITIASVGNLLCGFYALCYDCNRMSIEGITGGDVAHTRYLGRVYFQGHWWTLWHGPQGFRATSAAGSCDAIIGLMRLVRGVLDFAYPLGDRHLNKICVSLDVSGLIYVRRRESIIFLGICGDF